MLVLAQLTALRGEASIGPLDVALVASALLAAIMSLDLTRPDAISTNSGQQNGGFVTAISSPFSGYAILSALVITISYVLNAQRPAASVENLATASIAFYTISGLMICMAMVLYSRASGAMISGFITASLILALVYALGAVTRVEAMLYFGERFTGFASNPNQTALLSLGTFVAILASLNHSVCRRPFVRLMAYGCLLLTLVYGFATGSDALLLSLPSAFAMGGILVLDRFKVKLWMVVVAAIVLLAAFLIIVGIYVPGIFEVIGVKIQNQLSAGSQDTDRQLLWNHGLVAWSYSPWFGNGAGGWSGYGGPFQGQEAHNSVIDWLSISGVVGLLPLIILLIGFFQIKREFKLFCIFGLFSLVIFIQFHFTFRLPIFWFTIAMLMIPFGGKNSEEAEHARQAVGGPERA